ncbi:hypothetical protein J7382_11950 [Shimia sp. R11_0]|uniref:hypothetical protein n=1 Tax=Shimia sp. R11_0 TaxID=2821096 RepID=UPI001ADB1FD5|nr:hypothetical protein [Shimia sp. R11_0]MBO9478249.1 hypothetical protein [Shimia sp. R11_0]
MIEVLETEFTYGDAPANISASDVALEAGVSEVDAATMIVASWIQAETFCNRAFRPITSGKVVIKVAQEQAWQWPRYPYPDDLVIEVHSKGSWVSHSETYVAVAGLVELVPWTLYRLTQSGTVTPPPPNDTVVQAVKNLALYQLVQMPQRREFKSQTAGDTSLTREEIKGLFYASGAGALLASEVRQ